MSRHDLLEGQYGSEIEEPGNSTDCDLDSLPRGVWRDRSHCDDEKKAAKRITRREVNEVKDCIQSRYINLHREQPN